MALDKDLAKRAQEELEKKSGGTNFFVRLDENETKDIKVLDPSPSMNGIWFVEIPIWWVGKTKITSPEFAGGSDVVQKIIDDFEKDFKREGKQAEKDFKKLCEAKHAWGGPLIKKETEYWAPILEFQWEFNDKTDEIEGIYDDNDKIDASLVDKYVVDQKAKVFSMKISLANEINKIATSRGGYMLTDQADGFNLAVSRVGSKRDTKYNAVKTDDMPVPEKYYDLSKDGIDLVKIAKAQIYTEEYIESVLANYFYGEKLEDVTDSDYAYPELRKKSEEKEEEEQEDASPRRRRGTAKAESKEEPEQVSPRRKARVEEEEEERLAPRSRSSASRRKAAEAEEGPAPRKRSLIDDVDDA